MLLGIILFVTFILAAFKIYNKLTCGICRSSAHLVGKVAIVTGANAGVGYETAKDFAERGARVILACLNESLAVAACKRIEAETGSKDVHYRHLDLSSLKSVREFAKITLETEKRLDILVNNAGAIIFGKKYTDDGMLLCMQTNHFGPFLLTNLLLPLLKSSPPSRIVNVASYVHNFANIDIEDLNLNNVSEEKFSSSRVYNNSKLCNILMTAELSKKLKGTGVTANSLHPGVVDTDIMKNNTNVPMKFNKYPFIKVFYKFTKTSWEGAQTQIYLSVSPDVRDVSGKYFSDCKEKSVSKLASDSYLAQRLWEKSEEFVRLK